MSIYMYLVSHDRSGSIKPTPNCPTPRGLAATAGVLKSTLDYTRNCPVERASVDSRSQLPVTHRCGMPVGHSQAPESWLGQAVEATHWLVHVPRPSHVSRKLTRKSCGHCPWKWTDDGSRAMGGCKPWSNAREIAQPTRIATFLQQQAAVRSRSTERTREVQPKSELLKL